MASNTSGTKALTLQDLFEYVGEVSIPKDVPKITHLFIHPVVWQNLGCPVLVEVEEGGAILLGTDASLPFQRARAECIDDDEPGILN